MALNQFCGLFAIITYSASMFEQFGSNLSPIMSSIVVAVIQIVGATMSSLFVERAGRKLMMSISAFGTSLGLAVLGGYIMLQAQGMDLKAYNFIPLVTFSILIFVANLGVLTLPFMIMSEIAPPKV